MTSTKKILANQNRLGSSRVMQKEKNYEYY